MSAASSRPRTPAMSAAVTGPAKTDSSARIVASSSVEPLLRPGQHGGQAAVALGHVAPGGAEGIDALVQDVGQLGQAGGRQLCGGHLDGEGEPVESPDDPRHELVVGGQVEVADRGPGPLDEQAAAGRRRRRTAPSGATVHTCSPSTPSRSRLVVRTRTAGPPRTRRSTARAVSPMTCSALSSTTSTSRLPARCSASGLDACSLASPSSATTAPGRPRRRRAGPAPRSSRPGPAAARRPGRPRGPGGSCRRRRGPPASRHGRCRAGRQPAPGRCRGRRRRTPRAAGARRWPARPPPAGAGAAPCSPNAPSSTACSARRRRGDGSSPASASAAAARWKAAERLGVPVGARQPLHEHGPGPFTERLPGHQRLGGGDGLGLAARLEQQPGAALGDLAPALVQPPGLGAHARTVGFLGVGGTTPELERLARAAPPPGRGWRRPLPGPAARTGRRRCRAGPVTSW